MVKESKSLTKVVHAPEVVLDLVEDDREVVADLVRIQDPKVVQDLKDVARNPPPVNVQDLPRLNVQDLPLADLNQEVNLAPDRVLAHDQLRLKNTPGVEAAPEADLVRSQDLHRPKETYCSAHTQFF